MGWVGSGKNFVRLG